MANTQHGVILIADITGYTVFLRDSELAHAQETLTSLLELLVAETRPPLVVSKLVGDAVLSYGLASGVRRGQTFIEIIETTYVHFRKALELMVINTTCKCNACANISALDLKFFVHCGEFALADVAGQEELQGTDVNVAHRLTKNSIIDDTSFKAYAVYTSQAVKELELHAMTGVMTAHTEVYDDVGTVECFVQDLHPVWEAQRSKSTVDIDDSEVIIELDVEIALPPEVVWGYFMDPDYRATASGSDSQEATETTNGRIAEDTVYVCYHGDQVVTSAIVEYSPFERLVTRNQTPIPKTPLLADWHFERTDTGTRLISRYARPEGPAWGRLATRLVLPRVKKDFQKHLDAFRDRIEAEHRLAASA